MALNLKFTGKSLLLVAMTVMAASCHHHDDVGPVTPPDVNPAPNKLIGYVTDINGSPIQGATVTLENINATTGTNGYYEIDNVNPGMYEVSASADGMLPVVETITLSSAQITQYYQWNASLYQDTSVDFDYIYNEGGEAETVTASMKLNTLAQIPIEVAIVAEEISEDAELTLTPIYSEYAPMDVRAAVPDGNHMLVGCVLSTDNPNAEILKPIAVYFDLGTVNNTAYQAKVYRNGEWVATESTIEGDNVAVYISQFGPFGLFADITVTESTSYDNLAFSQSMWDNTGGASNMNVGEASFTYMTGSEFTGTATNPFQALLKEYLARELSALTSTSVTGSYPINITLPMGTFLRISGTQEKKNITVSNNNQSSGAVTYGTLSFTVTTANQDHQGGGN